jgi:hypothetical protein
LTSSYQSKENKDGQDRVQWRGFKAVVTLLTIRLCRNRDTLKYGKQPTLVKEDPALFGLFVRKNYE